MGCSAHTTAKRAFVSVILALARAYQLIVDVNRDSDDVPILKAYRRIILKVHPDKGGKKVDMQRLQDLCPSTRHTPARAHPR